jgi:hypothetical protein
VERQVSSVCRFFLPENFVKSPSSFGRFLGKLDIIFYFALLISNLSGSRGYSMMPFDWSFFLKFSTRRRLTPRSE